MDAFLWFEGEMKLYGDELHLKVVRHSKGRDGPMLVADIPFKNPIPEDPPRAKTNCYPGEEIVAPKGVLPN
ncbi:MAG: hypothetical protein O2960_24925, partial [Verrucomicrobia bacterium]|nr:hypothetical protein [Verrucomicrobiota bacterium]